jgi:hypothetical protein
MSLTRLWVLWAKIPLQTSESLSKLCGVKRWLRSRNNGGREARAGGTLAEQWWLLGVGACQRPPIWTRRLSVGKSRARPPKILGTKVQILHPQRCEKERKCPGYRSYANGQDNERSLPTPSPLPAPAHYLRRIIWLPARSLFFSIRFRLTCTRTSTATQTDPPRC